MRLVGAFMTLNA